MNEIKNQTLDFFEFYKILCGFLNEKGELKNILIQGNHITGIPNNLGVMELQTSKHFLGFTTRKSWARLFGLKVDSNITLLNNTFQNINKNSSELHGSFVLKQYK